MMTSNPDTLLHRRQFVLERCLFHAQTHLSLVGPMFANEAEFAIYADRCAENLVLGLQTSAIKGEVVDESRTVKGEYSFDVFATWWDHLKYALLKRRVLPWLPQRWTRGLAVKYVKVNRTWEQSVPVKVTKICPHATFKWDGQMRKHIDFLEGE